MPMVRLIPPLLLSRSEKAELFDEGAAVGLLLVTVGATAATVDPVATVYEMEREERRKDVFVVLFD